MVIITNIALIIFIAEPPQLEIMYSAYSTLYSVLRILRTLDWEIANIISNILISIISQKGKNMAGCNAANRTKRISGSLRDWPH